MKILILICLCIGGALALPSSEVTSAPELKPVVVEHHPEVNSLPVRTVEQLVPEVQSDDGAKESLEPAASAYGYRGWGGYGGYGGGGGYYRSYGGYGGGGYGGGYGWGGYSKPYYGRQYGGYGSYW